MTAPMDIEIVLRRRYIQFIEEYVGHARIEVLAGMHHPLRQSIGFPDRPADRSRLDELRKGTDDGENFQRQPIPAQGRRKSEASSPASPRLGQEIRRSSCEGLPPAA